MYIVWSLAETKNNIAMFDFEDFFPSLRTANFVSFSGKVIDTDKYDVIEKPDYKKRRLEEEIKALESRQEYYQTTADSYLEYAKKAKEKQEKLRKELKELK